MMGAGSIRQATPSSLKPAWMFIVRVLSSTRKTPAKAPSKGTTAELKMLFERGSRSRGMTGFRLDRQSGPTCPAGRSCQGMEAGVDGASIGVDMARGPSCGTLTRRLLRCP